MIIIVNLSFIYLLPLFLINRSYFYSITYLVSFISLIINLTIYKIILRKIKIAIILFT